MCRTQQYKHFYTKDYKSNEEKEEGLVWWSDQRWNNCSQFKAPTVFIKQLLMKEFEWFWSLDKKGAFLLKTQSSWSENV